MALTEQQWTTTEKPALVAIKSETLQSATDIQYVIDSIDAAFAAPVGATLWDRAGVAGTPVYSNSDLTVAATAVHLIRSNVSPGAGKYYFEVHIPSVGSAGYFGIGWVRDDQSISSPPNSLNTTPSGLWMLRSDGYKSHGGVSSSGGPAWVSGANIGLYRDENGNAWFRYNGAWTQGNPETATNPVFTGLTGNLGAALVFMGANGSPIATGRFTSPLHTPPTGALLLEAA